MGDPPNRPHEILSPQLQNFPHARQGLFEFCIGGLERLKLPGKLDVEGPVHGAAGRNKAVESAVVLR